jgi:hypothetical protein
VGRTATYINSRTATAPQQTALANLEEKKRLRTSSLRCRSATPKYAPRKPLAPGVVVHNADHIREIRSRVISSPQDADHGDHPLADSSHGLLLGRRGDGELLSRRLGADVGANGEVHELRDVAVDLGDIRAVLEPACEEFADRAEGATAMSRDSDSG